MSLHRRVGEDGLHASGQWLFIIGGAFTEEAEAFLQRKDVRSLFKPFRRTALIRAIEALLGAPEQV